MKKHLLFLALMSISLQGFSQLTSKKGEPYLPEAGDWSLGVDATPFLDYVGNLFNDSGNSAPSQNFLNANQTLIGKYFATEKMAYRGILRIGTSSQTYTNPIALYDTATVIFPAVPATVEDEYVEKSSFIGLGGGIEFRRGKTRLQGYYGGDLMFSFSNSSRSYTYGNALNDSTGVSAITTDFAAVVLDAPSNIISYNPLSNTTARINETKDGSTFAVTLRGFVGCEYFVAPKISIAGEFGWGLSFARRGASEMTFESVSYNGTENVVGSQTMTGGSNGRFTIDTDRNLTGTTTGALRLNFHF